MKIKDIYEFLLEIVFPSTLIEQRVRKMDFNDFNRLKLVNLDAERKVLSFFKYKNPFIREAIRQIKYRRNERLLKIFAEIIYEELLEELSDMELFENFSSPVLVPIPMSGSEKRERGYNQVELLVKEIEGVSGRSLRTDFNLLRKIKGTPRQTKLKREERLKNIKDAFGLSRLNIKNLNVVLVDDVSTTGSTIGEARSVLESAGAKVFSIVIAT